MNPVAAPGTMTKIGAATAILDGIGAPVNRNTVGAMVGWMNAEGGNWNNNAAHNPLNTTLNMPGSQTVNGVGVRSYNNWATGIHATVQTLKQSNMSGIVDAFRQGNPQAVIHAIAASPWGTSGSLVAQTIGAAMNQKFTVPSTSGIAQQMAGGGKVRGTGAPLPAVTGTNWGSDIANAMLTESAAPVSESGSVRVENPLAIAMANAGQYKMSIPGQAAKTIEISGQAVSDAASAGAGADAQKLLGMIHQVVGGAYNQGNHADIGESAKQIRASGTDCSGFVSWLMGPRGLGIWNTSLATPNIANAPGMQAGRGSVITVWNNKQPGNAGHVFIQIGSQFFASEGGVGIRQISTAEAMNYIQHGSDGGTYQALHPKGL